MHIAATQIHADGCTPRLFSLTLSLWHTCGAERDGVIKAPVEWPSFIHTLTSAFFSGWMRPFSVRHVKAGGFWRLSISSEIQQKE